MQREGCKLHADRPQTGTWAQDHLTANPKVQDIPFKQYFHRSICSWLRQKKQLRCILPMCGPVQCFDWDEVDSSVYFIRSGFILVSESLFFTDQYGRWRLRKLELLYQTLRDLGSNDILMGFSPHAVRSQRFMRLAAVLWRICVSALRERCSELMQEICELLWVFFISFQALFFSLIYVPLLLNIAVEKTLANGI